MQPVVERACPPAIVERAYPKINLTLRVLGRRPDGYHELDSLVAFAVDVGDVVTLVPGAAQSVSVTGRFGSSIAGENLIQVTLDRIAVAGPGLRLGAVTLEKLLPIAAGIGGGSADAAAVLRAVRRANAVAAKGIDWSAIAVGIGADVPVCLASRAQRMTGIGERCEPLPDLPELAVVLVNPLTPVPDDKTAQVFRTLAAKPLEAASASAGRGVFDRAGLLACMTEAGNDLTAAARQVVPAIDTVLAMLRREAACELAQLSGGGPTCFGVFPDLATARTVAARLKVANPGWWIVASRLV